MTGPTCAICGYDVEENRAEITVEWREEPPEEFAMHTWCAQSTVGSWNDPG